MCERDTEITAGISASALAPARATARLRLRLRRSHPCRFSPSPPSATRPLQPLKPQPLRSPPGPRHLCSALQLPPQYFRKKNSATPFDHPKPVCGAYSPPRPGCPPASRASYFSCMNPVEASRRALPATHLLAGVYGTDTLWHVLASLTCEAVGAWRTSVMCEVSRRTGLRAQGAGCRVQGAGCKVWGVRCGV
jgi:hypothetical protein